MHASVAEQIQFFEEVVLPAYREFEAELYAFMGGAASEPELKRRFLLAAWAADHFLDLVTGQDACRQLTLEHTELGIRILRRVVRDLNYAKASICSHTLPGDEGLTEPTISELLKSIPQLRVLVNVAEPDETPDMLEVDLFSCLDACVEFWQNTLPQAETRG